MLTTLTIQNIVLIDRLTLEPEKGLLALTGETGAGKSILLDALGLALGARADAGLVRHGEDQANVTAVFELPQRHPLHAFLKEKEINAGEGLILRRTLGKDGRSKAFVNDAPVSAQLLKEIGAFLVEVHGQFETQGLLNPETHLDVLDAYAGLSADTVDLKNTWQDFRAARQKLEAATAESETLRLQEDYLRHAVGELEDLSPEAGEEDILAAKRAALRSRDKVNEGLGIAAEILAGEDGIESLLARLENVLSRLPESASREGLLGTLRQTLPDINDLSYQIERIKNGKDLGDETLEEVEERYFSLKECAKKHRVTTDNLPRLLDELKEKLHLITDRDAALDRLSRDLEKKRELYVRKAEALSATRIKAGKKLSKAVNGELPDLKLGGATFDLSFVRKEEDGWNENGIDQVQFVVATNPKTPPAPLHKIASGGELSRFMLAIKVIIAETGTIPTLVFDEVDSGIGGATADAVALRLFRLARKYQVLAVTHSPQVAVRAEHHFVVSKSEKKGGVITAITPLPSEAARAEEIARMISGATITKEARAAAVKLLESHAA